MATSRMDELLSADTTCEQRLTQFGASWPSDPLDQLLERVLVVRDALCLLQKTGAKGKSLSTAQASVNTCVEHCRSQQLAIEAGAHTATTRLQDLCVEAEVAVRLLERDLPMDSFVPGFVESALAKDAIARLARLLAPLCGDNGDTRDRYEFLVTRLVRLRGPSGFILLPRESVQGALDYVAPVELRVCTEDIRFRVMFFAEDMAARITAAGDIEKVLAQDIYGELYGYKLALRDRILDPDVLYALASLNTSMCDRLQLAVARTGNSEPYLRRITETEIQVRAVLEGDDGKQKLRRRFQEERRRAIVSPARPRTVTLKAVPAVRPGHPSPRATSPRRALAVAAAVAALLIVATAFAMGGPSPYRAEPVPRAELSRLSPVLASGKILVAQRAFLGQVQAERWEGLDPTMKQNEARSLRQALKQRQVDVIILQRGDTVVCEIDRRGDIEIW
ncbi:MAG: hypothetical protein ABIJ09_26595 [Pseudomonadota bacterium]